MTKVFLLLHANAAKLNAKNPFYLGLNNVLVFFSAFGLEVL